MRTKYHRSCTGDSVVRRLLNSVRAATAVEYGLIVGLLVIVMLVGLTQLGSATKGLLNLIDSNVAAATQNR